jgi:hypothetical protein
MTEVSAAAREEARRHVRRKRILYTVLGVWLVLCVLWSFIDVSDDSSSWWFYGQCWALASSLQSPSVVLLGVGGVFGVDWESQQIERYLHRRGGEAD